MMRTGCWSIAVLRRILRLGLCLAGKKENDWLIISDRHLTMEERATLLPGSCRTYSNSFSLEDIVRNPKWYSKVVSSLCQSLRSQGSLSC